MTELGFIFDLDGTIIDSLGYYRQVWQELLDECESDHDVSPFLTRPTRENFRILLGDELPEHEMEHHVARQAAMGQAKMQTQGVRVNQGIRELIRGLRAQNVKLAVATAAEPANAEWALQNAGLRDFFETVVTDRDVENGKPAPDIYLEAMYRLGVDTSRCAVLEDSPLGIRGAKRAGIKVIGIVTTHARIEIEQAGADLIVHSANELDAANVIRFILSTHENKKS